jgi:hypothetical protein
MNVRLLCGRKYGYRPGTTCPAYTSLMTELERDESQDHRYIFSVLSQWLTSICCSTGRQSSTEELGQVF